MSSHAPGLENRELFKSPRSVHLPSAMSKAPIVKREFCFPSDVQLLSVIDFPLRIANFVEKLPTLHALQFRLRLSDRSCVKDRSGTERQNDATAARRRRRQQQPEEQQRSAVPAAAAAFAHLFWLYGTRTRTATHTRTHHARPSHQEEAAAAESAAESATSFE